MPGYDGTCKICGGRLEDIAIHRRYECDTCGYKYYYDENREEYSEDDIVINIKTVKELPANVGWDYPLEEIDYLMEQIRDGDRENGCTMLLFEERLYELEV